MEIKRNKDGTIEGMSTMGDFVEEELSDEAKERLKKKEEYEKKIIIEYFANDDSPATITDIEHLTELDEHYYRVKGKDDNGEFETSVFVDDDSTIQILPE